MRAGKYIVQTLQYPEAQPDPDYRAMYSRFARRILWIGGNVVPGAFQMTSSWDCKVPERSPVFPGTPTTATKSSASSAAARSTPMTWVGAAHHAGRRGTHHHGLLHDLRSGQHAPHALGISAG